MKWSRIPWTTAGGFLLFSFFISPSSAVAHGTQMNESGMASEVEQPVHGHNHSEAMAGSAGEVVYSPTYFAHPEHAAMLYAHIILMAISWVFVLPIGVMISLVKSRYTLAVQTLFTTTNGVGLLLAVVYNARTPDLYPNNSHHKIGWIVTGVASIQVLFSGIRWLSGKKGPVSAKKPSQEDVAFLQTSSPTFSTSYDFQRSDQDSEGSNRSSSASTVWADEDHQHIYQSQDNHNFTRMNDRYHSYEDLDLEVNYSNTLQGKMSKAVSALVASPSWRHLGILYEVVDRILLPLGFIALATGIVTMGRFFEGKAILNGLAHWVKGGVFFWLGLFNLGRWAGSFSEVGWAWNVRPGKSTKWRPSAEFMESALIFFYGSTNIFLEHLGNPGGEWAAQDLEHLSITVLFIGGGACGMIIESTSIRALLNVSAAVETPMRELSLKDEENGQTEALPETKGVSLNPIPALVILLVGMMMSSHHQKSMMSTMLHKQWGNLLAGASLARALTYVILYIRPPTSVSPSRPPTELLTSFGLLAGGILFMASSADVVEGMIHYDLDPMFMHTVTMGLVVLLMAWELIVLAIKGLAARCERRMAFSRLD